MMNSTGPSGLETLTRPYLRRKHLLTLWNGLLLLLVLSFPALLFIGWFGFHPLIGIYGAAALAASLGISVLRKKGNPLLLVDGWIEAGGELVTLVDTLERDPANPFRPLLERRIEQACRRRPPESCLPLKTGSRFWKTLGLLLLCSGALFLPRLALDSDPGYREILARTSERLAAAAEEQPEFAPLAEKLGEMEKELEGEGKLPREETLEDISRELTEEIRELERNTLSDLFEEKGEELAEKWERLSRGEMSLPETREFVMDLLEETGSGNEKGSSIQRSFRDFSESNGGAEQPGRQNQEKLAEDLLEGLAPEGRGLRKELKNLLEELEGPGRDEGETAEATEAEDEKAGAADEETAERASRRTDPGERGSPAQEPEEAGATTTAAGDRTGTEEEDPLFFSPDGGEHPEASLPEGKVLAGGDRGVLRLEGDEEVNLERLSPDFPAGGAVIEEETGRETISEGNREIVKKYFTVIGTGTDIDD